MREYSVEHSSFTFKWTFKRMLPALPGPGTPGFAELCKGLHPYGITPSKVVLDSPTSRLSDVTLGIGLLDNRVAIRITPSALELTVNDLFLGDEEKLVPIADLLFAAVSSVDTDATQGTANIRVVSHMRLAPGEAETLLGEHTSAAAGSLLALDAVIYKVRLGKESRAQALSITLAKSLAYEGSIFVDMHGDYEGPATPTELAAHISADYERLIEVLGLKEQDSEGRVS